MKKTASLILLSLWLGCGGPGADVDPLGLGEKLPAAAVPTGHLLMAGPAIQLPSYVLELDGVPYALAAKDGIVLYVSTKAPSFETPDGAKVGDSYARVRELAGREAVTERGWAYVVALPSGWNAGFFQGRRMTEGDLADETPVAFFFRRASVPAPDRR